MLAIKTSFTQRKLRFSVCASLEMPLVRQLLRRRAMLRYIVSLTPTYTERGIDGP